MVMVRGRESLLDKFDLADAGEREEQGQEDDEEEEVEE